MVVVGPFEARLRRVHALTASILNYIRMYSIYIYLCETCVSVVFALWPRNNATDYIRLTFALASQLLGSCLVRLGTQKCREHLIVITCRIRSVIYIRRVITAVVMMCWCWRTCRMFAWNFLSTQQNEENKGVHLYVHIEAHADTSYACARVLSDAEQSPNLLGFALIEKQIEWFTSPSAKSSSPYANRALAVLCQIRVTHSKRLDCMHSLARAFALEWNVPHWTEIEILTASHPNILRCSLVRSLHIFCADSISLVITAQISPIRVLCIYYTKPKSS